MSTLANALDSALEWSVFGSFTRIGSDVRKGLDHWRAPPANCMNHKVVVITGATSGLGLHTARALAALGATVCMVVRNREKAQQICAQLRSETNNSRIEFIIADTGDLNAIRNAAAELITKYPAIDVLIHNAGALDDERQVSPQGMELTVASQVVGPFLLTALLQNALRAAAPSRVLWVSSGGMYSEPLSVNQLEMPAENYRGVTAYARAKRAQVTLTEMLAARLADQKIHVHAMHPGWADTPGVARSLPTFRRIVGPLLRTPEQGADTLIWLATDNDAPLASTGQLWLDRRPRPLHRLASTQRSDTPQERERLWRWVVEKSGADLGPPPRVAA
jgi:dehydrogenase/reductase SDR family protein 12